jgi:hypothetical protein
VQAIIWSIVIVILFTLVDVFLEYWRGSSKRSGSLGGIDMNNPNDVTNLVPVHFELGEVGLRERVVENLKSSSHETQESAKEQANNVAR